MGLWTQASVPHKRHIIQIIFREWGVNVLGGGKKKNNEHTFVCIHFSDFLSITRQFSFVLTLSNAIDTYTTLVDTTQCIWLLFYFSCGLQKSMHFPCKILGNLTFLASTGRLNIQIILCLFFKLRKLLQQAARSREKVCHITLQTKISKSLIYSFSSFSFVLISHFLALGRRIHLRRKLKRRRQGLQS